MTSRQPDSNPALLLLPYGTDSTGITQLRYSYRMTLRGMSRSIEASFLLWLDADSGRILKLVPLTSDGVQAEGIAYDRNPGVGTMPVRFEVDEANEQGVYVLELEDVFAGVIHRDNDNAADEVSIRVGEHGSTPEFANFNQPPINDERAARCASGNNKQFLQVHLYAMLSRYRAEALSFGIFEPFPARPLTVIVFDRPGFCNAGHSPGELHFGACAGYFHENCPDASDGADNHENNLHAAQDNTVVAHEFGHAITKQMTLLRPMNWCGRQDDCPIPVGWGLFHDLADFWADHFESTNCYGGWLAKNDGGRDHSLNCGLDRPEGAGGGIAPHSEGGLSPRLHEVSVPFDPTASGDHFPEHRRRDLVGGGPYSEGQIAAAALWQVRLGMRSRAGLLGLAAFAVNYSRALGKAGDLGQEPPASDSGLYRLLYDLEQQMTHEWGASGYRQ